MILNMLVSHPKVDVLHHPNSNVSEHALSHPKLHVFFFFYKPNLDDSECVSNFLCHPKVGVLHNPFWMVMHLPKLDVLYHLNLDDSEHACNGLYKTSIFR